MRHRLQPRRQSLLERRLWSESADRPPGAIPPTLTIREPNSSSEPTPAVDDSAAHLWFGQGLPSPGLEPFSWLPSPSRPAGYSCLTTSDNFVQDPKLVLCRPAYLRTPDGLEGFRGSFDGGCVIVFGEKDGGLGEQPVEWLD